MRNVTKDIGLRLFEIHNPVNRKTGELQLLEALYSFLSGCGIYKRTGTSQENTAIENLVKKGKRRFVPVHHTMKTYGGVNVQVHLFLTSGTRRW